MKKLFSILVFAILGASAFAAVAIQKSTAGPAGALTDGFRVPTGTTVTFDAGSTLDTTGATLTGIPAPIPLSYLDTDVTMAANSNAKVPSQAAIRAYIAANSTAAFSGLTGQPTDNANLSTALSGKVSTSVTVNGHALTSNVTVTKSDVGLGGADNTADADKPVSTAQTTAINAKVADAIADTVTTVAPSQNAVFDALALKETPAGAQAKADAAESDAIAAAATDATTKANAAQAAAIAASTPVISRAALASDALTLSKSNIVRTGTVSATKTFTLASAGSTSDWIELELDVSGTQTIGTDFAVYRNGAGASAVVSEAFTDFARIWIRNTGGGVIRWVDSKYVDRDMPVTYVPSEYEATTTRLDGHLQGIDNTLNYLAGVANSGGSGLSVGSYFGWSTADIANKPADAIVADATGATNSGVINVGTLASGAMTWLAMGNGTAVTPTVSPSAGTYDEAQSATFTTTTPGASIYYTSATPPSVPADPTPSDTLYTTPVAVADDTTFKAKAFATLYHPSAVFLVEYVIDLVTALFTTDYETNSKPAAQTGNLSIDATSKAYGTYSVKGINSSSLDTITIPGGQIDECWMYVTYRPANISSTPEVIRAYSAGGTFLWRLRAKTDGSFRLYQADNATTIDGGSAGSFAADTITGVWIHYKYVTSGTSEVRFYVNKTAPKTKPASPQFTSTVLTAASGVGQFRFTPGTTVTIYWDNPLIQASIIGDIP